MGLGKTAQALRALPGPGIVACPASLMAVWFAECQKWRSDINPEIVLGPSELRKPGPRELLILSVDGLPWPEEETDARILREGMTGVTLIVDEAQSGKNVEAQRSRLLDMLAKHCGRVWCLTGTPLLGTPEDLWGVLVLAQLVEVTFGSRATFEKLFGYANGKWPERPPHLEEIRRRLKPHMLRRRIEAVLPSLSKIQHEEIWVDAPEDLLDRLAEADAKWLEIGPRDLPPFELLAELRNELAKSRIPALLDYVKDCEREGDSPLVLFAEHVEPLLEIASSRPGWRAVTGETPISERNELVNAFQRGELRGLALSIGVGGTGFTLTESCHGIFASMSYTPGKNEQTIRRIVRIGQKAKKVRITRFVTDHPVERRLLKILDAKTRRIRAVIDGEMV